jgi:two-component system chemotaxis response regulator CheY
MNKSVLLVGHCGIDGPRLQKYVESLDGEFQCRSAASEEELDAAVRQGVDLVLFNRALTGSFEVSEGIELIRRLKEDHPDTKVMLVSDRAEAQRHAMQLGALPGFGKSEIDTPKVVEMIKDALLH